MMMALVGHRLPKCHQPNKSANPTTGSGIHSQSGVRKTLHLRVISFLPTVRIVLGMMFGAGACQYQLVQS